MNRRRLLTLAVLWTWPLAQALAADGPVPEASPAVPKYRSVPALDPGREGTAVGLTGPRAHPAGSESSGAARPVGPRAQYSALEQEAVRLSREWANRKVSPGRDEDGIVRYVYGAGLPSLVCSPIYVCDLSLEPGETVNALHTGDLARWKVSVAVSGSEGAVSHILVKPQEAGLRTNLVILTDRRTYVVQLVSDDKDWMARIAFTYPKEDAAKELAEYQLKKQAEKRETLPDGQAIPDLDFDFKISGDAPWRPIRVYTDGTKTYLDFPLGMTNEESPALVAIGPGGAEQIVNYRVAGTRYVVDKVLSRAMLVSGVGRWQQKVEILHTKGMSERVVRRGKRS